MKILLILAALLTLAGCRPRGTSKADVDAAAARQDPATLTLDTGATGYVKRTILPSRVETGIITLGDGERVKYWFQSHHLGHDLGHTRFQYHDGTVDYLEGYFCCEVILPDEPPADRKELKQFIAANDGKSP
jgi:hypothetical protein